jgi:hypothetical protein
LDPTNEEADNGCSLRVHAAEDVPNDAVLPGCVERLQHTEKGLLSNGEEQFLQPVDALDLPASIVRASLAINWRA